MTTLADQLSELTLDSLPVRWLRLGLDHASDAQLIAAVVSHVAAPVRAATSSFQLHAPLELLARAALLPLVEPSARDPARQKLVEIAIRYRAETEPAQRAERSFATTDHAAAALTEGLAAGDPDTADAALAYLRPREPAILTLARLHPLLVDHLGAAAHAPIFAAQLPRVVDRIPDVATLLHPLLRNLTETRVRLTWHHQPRPETALPPATAERLLVERLLAPPHTPSSSLFIEPTLLAVERTGLAAELFGDLWRCIDSTRAERFLSRVAAWSMLQDAPAHAPYGWTHALTLPQSVLQMTHHTPEARAAVAVAATQLLGFRATLGTVALVPDAPLPPAPAAPTERATQLATAAARHSDAHFAKYVIACFDAAARDPAAIALYLAAAEHLAAFWATGTASFD